MPLFQYKALVNGDQERTGVIEAEDPSSAAAILRGQGSFVLMLTETQGGLPQKTGRRRPWEYGVGEALRHFIPVRTRDLVFFFQQLALMLRSGLSLLEALEICRGQSSKARLAAALDRMIQSVQGGSPLSTAMANEKSFFPGIAVKMVVTAEATGELAPILDRIVGQLDRKQELKTNLLTSLIYPSVVMLVSIGVIVFLITHVIPKFTRFLQNKRIALPGSTQFLMDLSAFVNANGATILLALAVLAVAMVLLYLTPKGRYRFDRFLLSLPVVGGLLIVALMAHLGRSLSMLLRSGVTLLDGIQILRESVTNRAVSAHLKQTEQEVLKGRSFSQALQGTFIPSLVIEVVNVGEQAGALDQVLEEVGEYYEKNLQRRIKRMGALVEPAMILVVGGIVGFVYFAFFQVLFQAVTK